MARTLPSSTPLARGAAAAAVLCALLAGGCGSEPTVDAYLAEYIPYSTNGVDTDIIFPREEGASRFLLRNWPPLRTLEGDSMWIHGTWARLGFFSVADEPPKLVAEAQPYAHPDAPLQSLSVSLNGVQVGSTPMRARWETYEFDLPAEAVKVGWNEVTFDFAHSLRPADFDPDSDDRRTLAARFRRLEIVGASARPPWPDRPAEVRLVVPGVEPTAEPAALEEDAAEGAVLVADAEVDASAMTIEMPTDSFLEVYVGPGADTELVGDLEVAFVEPSAGGAISVVAEVVEPEWTTRVWQTELTPGSTPDPLRADLSGWAGQAIGLRLRVFGDTNGLVTWHGLGTTSSDDDSGAVFDPTRVVSPPRTGDLDRPDIFVIVLDAARADAFDGSRGADLTPTVARLAADGTRFTHAWAPSSWTGQTIPALLAGMSPDAVGIESWASRLPPSVIKFPEILLDAGYRTVLWSQHNIYRSQQALRHGFEAFDEVDSADLAAREILPTADWMLADDRPTFALVHLLPPHNPYEPPAPFAGSRSGWFDRELHVDANLLWNIDRRIPDDAELRDEVRRVAIARYEENVQFADHLVGRLVADLENAGRYDEAMIVVISDHGEAFYEHELYLHTRQLYEEFVRVPLVVKWPASWSGYEPVVDAPVTLLDVAPTIIDALGLDDERAAYQGRTLMPLVRGGAAPNRLIYAYTRGVTNPETGPKPFYALRWGDMKLIWDEKLQEASLFKLSTDPLEQDNVALQMPFYTGMLTQFLKLAQANNARLLLAAGGTRAEELSEETIRNLRALGYLR